MKNEHLKALLGFQYASFFIELDSVYGKKNDRIRNHAGAFEAAEEAIQMISDAHLSCLIKMLVREETIDEMNDMLILAQTNRCDGIIFSGEIVSFDTRNFISKDCFKDMMVKICNLQKKYNSRLFFVGTAEPLMRLLSMKGFACPAGISSFHMTTTGETTPCLYLQTPLDISSLENYRNSEFIQTILKRDLKGKCARCFNNHCVGCRARASNVKGDFHDEDPYCWL